jgi:branched-chain amino acid transport system substrate-binding protein
MSKWKRVLRATTGLVLLSAGAFALAADMPGVTDKEIRIGQTLPYSGQASAYASNGRAAVAYFAKVNAEGGINGRMVNLISLDDQFSPPKTVEQVRKLVEQDEVLAMYGMSGTATSASVEKYLNGKKIPQLFVMSGARTFQNPKEFPYTTPGILGYFAEARNYGRYILRTTPNAKVGILYQNDDFGKEYQKGIREGLGAAAAKMIVSEQSYDATDPTVDSQLIALRGAGADTLMIAAYSKQTSQAVKRIAEMGWKPQSFISFIAAAISPTLTNAGLDNATGLITANVIKDPTDPRWQGDAEYAEWLAWMKKYYPDGDLSNSSNVYVYAVSKAMEKLLRAAGNDLSRENLMKQAMNLKEYAAPMLLPGLTMNLSPTDYTTYRKMQLQKFDGKKWEFLGAPIGELRRRFARRVARVVRRRCADRGVAATLRRRQPGNLGLRAGAG